jgi:transposase-like protein
MRHTNGTRKSPGEKIVKDIKRATRKQYSSEEKIRIVLDGLRGEDSIAELCRREGISQGVYYKWSKDFMEAGKKRLAGDTARAATTDGDALVNMVKTQPAILSKISPDQIASMDNPYWFGQLIKTSDGKLSQQQIQAATPSALSTTAGKLTAQ